MANQMHQLNDEVTAFLDAQNHPFRAEIDQLRNCILAAKSELVENIKWNAPNYSFHNEDRITMKIQPPKHIQLIFHRGAKVKGQPKDKLIEEDFGMLSWKENDRAVATFKTVQEIEAAKNELKQLVQAWLKAAK